MTEWQGKRLQNANTIWETAQQLPGLRVPLIPQFIRHAAYKCYVFVENDQLTRGWDRDRILDAINAQGVPCYTGSCSEVYLEKAFEGTAWRPINRLPVARKLGETSLMFLVHPTLQAHEIEKTSQVLTEVLKLAMK